MADTVLPENGSVAQALEDMGPDRRLVAYEAGELSREQMVAWAALHPEEVPLVNGELPWIVATLADLD